MKYAARGIAKCSTSLLKAAFIVALCITRIQALSSPIAPTTAAKAASLTSANRIFVGDIPASTSKDDTGTSIQQELRDAFQSYGAVQDVHVIGAGESKRGCNAQPYAFVTFEDAESAQRALSAQVSSNNSLYGAVAPALGLRPTKRRKQSNAEWEKRLQLTKDCNVIVQVQKSHVERLGDLVASKNAIFGDDDAAEVLGSIDTTSRSASLLFIKAKHPVEFVKILYEVPYVAKSALKKVYLLSGAAIKGNLLLAELEGNGKDASTRSPTSCNIQDALFRHLESLSQQDGEKNVVVRLSVFPPKILPNILSIVEKYNNLNGAGGVTIGPTLNTHTLSIVQVNPEEVRDGKTTAHDAGLYMLGLADSDKEIDHAIRDENEKKKTDDNVCRAYYKLQEAFARYNANQPDAPNARGTATLPGYILKNNPVSLDCGAAPGGWTKYLSDELGSAKVFSVDPGSLSPAVIALSGVQHLRMTIADALLIVKESEDNIIDLWVSDMCLHEPSEQVDTLLEAREMGIVQSGTMFVLTLKFVRGHAKATFDKQAQEEVDRMEGIAAGIQMLHLFSNRIGERTIMGFIL